MKQETPNTPLEDALRRAYYYDEHGQWRGPETDEWARWHAVARVAAAMATKPNATSDWSMTGMYSDGSIVNCAVGQTGC